MYAAKYWERRHGTNQGCGVGRARSSGLQWLSEYIFPISSAPGKAIKGDLKTHLYKDPFSPNMENKVGQNKYDEPVRGTANEGKREKTRVKGWWEGG